MLVTVILLKLSNRSIFTCNTWFFHKNESAVRRSSQYATDYCFNTRCLNSRYFVHVEHWKTPFFLCGAIGQTLTLPSVIGFVPTVPRMKSVIHYFCITFSNCLQDITVCTIIHQHCQHKHLSNTSSGPTWMYNMDLYITLCFSFQVSYMRGNCDPWCNHAC